MTIFYEFEGKLYANITNKCPCSCVFCIRKNGDSVADNDSLWLEHEPSYEEIIKAFDDFDKTGLHELVFCGYGEPMERADVLLEVAKYYQNDNHQFQVKARQETMILISNVSKIVRKNSKFLCC